jgi:hypothetical protein
LWETAADVSSSKPKVSAAADLVFREAQFRIPKKLLASTCGLFDGQPNCGVLPPILFNRPSLSRSFVCLLAGWDLQPTHETAASFSLLVDEFGIAHLANASSMRFSEIPLELISALGQRLFNLETQIVSLSGPNQKRRFPSLEEHFVIHKRHVETFLPGLRSSKSMWTTI